MGESLRDLRGRVEARRDELEEAAHARIAAIGDPEQALNPAYAAALRAALAAGLDYGFAAIAAPEDEPGPVPVELLAQARLAAHNGVSLDTVLRRYSAGQALLADSLLEEAAALGLGAAELQAGLRALAVRHDAIVAALSQEHEREATAPRDTERRRQALIRRLLAGEPLDATTLNYELDGNHLAFVASGQAVAETLASLAERLDRRLLLVEPDTQLAWAWLGGGRRFTPDELHLLSAHPWPKGCAIACGEPGEGRGGWRLSHRQAAAALPVAQRAAETLIHYADVALLAATLQDDLLAISLRRTFLAPLESTRDGGAEAKSVLRAYFAAAGNISSAAAALGIGRRTVSNRLATIEMRLGRSLQAAQAELETALQLDALETPGADASS